MQQLWYRRAKPLFVSLPFIRVTANLAGLSAVPGSYLGKKHATRSSPSRRAVLRLCLGSQRVLAGIVRVAHRWICSLIDPLEGT
jgi:hypothetical protein